MNKDLMLKNIERWVNLRLEKVKDDENQCPNCGQRLE